MADEPDPLVAGITRLVPETLRSMEALEIAQRNMHPPRVPQLAEFIKPFHDSLIGNVQGFADLEFPEHMQGFQDRLAKAAEYVRRACDGLINHDAEMGNTMRAMRAICRAQETLYPIAALMSPVNQYFLEEPLRTNAEFAEQIATGADRDEVGLKHAANGRDERAGFSLFVPEWWDGTSELSLVMALHGGTGHGSDFIWSWLREARGRGFALIAPTSAQDTWSLMGEEYDLERLHEIVGFMKQHYPIDDDHIMLTGMSDGGTYSLLAGLREASPFTHLAPFSGVLHPEIAMNGNLRHGLHRKIYLVHGTVDWMFPIETAYMAQGELESVGADLTFRPIEGLSHTYARGENDALLNWFNPLLGLPESAPDAGENQDSGEQ